MIVTPGPYGKRGPGGKPPQSKPQPQPQSGPMPLLANRLWIHSYSRQLRQRSTWS